MLACSGSELRTPAASSAGREQSNRGRRMMAFPDAKEAGMATPSDQPGWRPDPEHAGMVRWWNGLGWSDARRSADESMDRVRAAAQDAMRGSTITPQ